MEKIRGFVRLVEAGLNQEQFTGKPQGLYDPIDYFMKIGGKRLRPALCLAACELFNGEAKHALKPAMGIEVFHNFSLVHDDIMDDADKRRGQSTVHEKWNLNTAILSGDTMLVMAYQLIAQVEPSILPEVLKTFSSIAIEVCEGQQYDMSFETMAAVSEAEYIEMIRLKTSVLLGASLKIGALVGGASAAEAEALYQFGENIGIAFQIQDDLLDAYGEPDKVGKKPGGDIIQNKQTLLRIQAWHHGGPSVQQALSKSYPNSSTKVTEIKQVFEDCGARNYVVKKRDFYFDQALVSLKSVKGAEDIKKELVEFSQWLIQREH